MTELSALRRRVINEMIGAGFELRGGQLVPPADATKEQLRQRHEQQRRAALYEAREFIATRESVLLDSFASGEEVQPESIHPRIEPVRTRLDADLFRFASLHWTVPVSRGYGRRSRFLIWDAANDKLIGLFALGDPVFNLKARDDVIGWSHEQRQERLYGVFDAFVLGAVEPYRQLLGGKLAALCAVSEEAIGYLETKYSGTTTVIQGKKKGSRPVLVTTTSALGRSSVYNRLAVDGRLIYRPVGYTAGFGHFQFSDELFEDLLALVSGNDGFRGNQYGQGPNWKIRTLRLALDELGLSGELLKHGIQRQVFLAPVAHNWVAYLRGESDIVRPSTLGLEHLSRFYLSRWAIPRATRRPEFRDWSREGMRLTSQLPGTPRVEKLF